MRRSKLIRMISVLLVFVMVLTACGKSESEKKDNDKKDEGSSKTVTENSAPSNADNGDEEKNVTSVPEPTSDEGKSSFGEKKLDLGDLDSDSLPVFPKEESLTMYYYCAKDLSEEVFFPDQTEIEGDPYCFNGTVLETIDDITSYLNMNEFGKTISGLDVSSKGYKVMTKYGPVIVIDPQPYSIQYMRDSITSMTETKNGSYSRYNSKLWFNDLSKYKKFPETGDTCCFYGFYYGYSAADDSPVFTYGVSNLAHYKFFKDDYLKYRSDKVKKVEYPLRISFKVPIGWSDGYYDNDQLIVYLPKNEGEVLCSSYDIQDMDISIDDAVKMLTGEMNYAQPEGAEEGNGQSYDVSEFLRVNSKEKVAIGDGSIEAVHVDLDSKNQDMTWQNVDLYVFKMKKYIVLMEYVILIDEEDADSNTQSDQGTEDSHGSKLKEVFDQEFEELLKTIVKNGY